MRFANPPGIASFLQKNAGYDQIGGRAVKDAVDQDLTTMGTMGQAQSNALSTIAQDKAAEYMRDAQAFGMAQQADANMFGQIASGVASLGSAGFQKFGGIGSTPSLSGPKIGTYDKAFNSGMDFGGFTPSEVFQKDIGYRIFN